MNDRTRRLTLRDLAKSRRLRDLAKSLSFKAFLVGDKLGVHVLPKHYYSPVPDYNWLKKNRHAWSERADLGAIPGWDLDAQLRWLGEICAPSYHEVAGLAPYRKIRSSRIGIGYGQTDSQVLHCFIRKEAPRQIVEIGGGFSTGDMLHAGELNSRDGKPPPEITCIEPSPRPAFQELKGIKLIAKPCQIVPLSEFTRLRSGDLLFVDSTHSVRTGSDVVRIYLQIIPRLSSGVFIHIHDINLPYLYRRDALSGFWGSQETAFLVALLTDNTRLLVLASLSALHYERRAELAELILDYRPEPDDEGLSKSGRASLTFGSSIWLRKN